VAAVRSETRSSGDVLIVCAGHERRMTLEDVVCAGRMARGIARGRTSVAWGDGARSAALIERRYLSDRDRLAREASHALSLSAGGFEADVRVCLTFDSQPLVVSYHERQLRQHDSVLASATTTAKPRV
ncbi:MAG: 2-phosphosulfolactate phosphatase, partial [Gemmatimonadaceae bacterium]